jgi:hypothetical protein
MVIPGQIATYPAIIAYVMVKRFNVLANQLQRMRSSIRTLGAKNI